MNETSNLRLCPSKIELPDNLIDISPLNLKINPAVDAIIPGVTMFGDYDYWRIDSNLPLRREEIEIVGQSVPGVTDVKWLDAYTSVFGIKKSQFFTVEGDDGVINKIIGTIREVYDHKKCNNGTCNCAQQYQEDFVEIAMEAVAEVERTLHKRGLLTKLIRGCKVTHAKAI